MIELDHIGIAVKSIDEFSKMFNDLFDADFQEVLNVSSQSVKATFSKPDSKIELIEAVGDNSPQYPMLKHPVLSFIDKKGEGMHHLCFNVDDLESYVSKLKEKDVTFVGDGIMIGSYGHKICFINPAHTKGILIELKQK